MTHDLIRLPLSENVWGRIRFSHAGATQFKTEPAGIPMAVLADEIAFQRFQRLRNGVKAVDLNVADQRSCFRQNPGFFRAISDSQKMPSTLVRRHRDIQISTIPQPNLRKRPNCFFRQMVLASVDPSVI